jgi:hypothetical protein
MSTPPYQPSHVTQRTGTPLANHSTPKQVPLPLSFEYARQAAKQCCAQTPGQPASIVSSTSAEVVGEPEERIRSLRVLAQWQRLHDPMLPSPIVGDIESDPWGVSDRYGVKGLSVLTAFVDMDDFSCWVCSSKAQTLELAVLHQQQARHFQP